MTTSTLIRRPLTPEFLRESLYLLGTFATGTLAFAVAVTTVSLSLSLLIFIVGIPLAAGCAYVHRAICDLDRRLVTVVGQEPVPRRYVPLDPDTGFFRRSLAVLGDRQAWGDLLWMFLGFWTSVLGASALSAAWASLGWMTYPLWCWALPDSTYGADGIWGVLIIVGHVPAGVLMAIAGSWAVRGMTHVQTTLARWALGMGREVELEERIEHLSATRADAVDESTAALQRIERDLHDGAQARLVALAMDLGMAEQKLASKETGVGGIEVDSARVLVTEARTQAQAAMGELRDLVRGIGPSILRERGLDAALSALVAGRVSPVDITVDVPERPPAAAETAAYFVAAEGLTNATKHARARRVGVRVWTDALDRLIVEVADDGRGGADPASGSGLSGLRKRVGALDGTLSVVSPVGGPTMLRAEIPLR